MLRSDETTSNQEARVFRLELKKERRIALKSAGTAEGRIVDGDEENEERAVELEKASQGGKAGPDTLRPRAHVTTPTYLHL